MFIVADFATELAHAKEANPDLARAAALLHDIADTETTRLDPGHDQKSMRIARQLLPESGYSNAEITTVVDDAIQFHSCRGSERPRSPEGKILATADALAHLKTDFYIYAAWALGAGAEKTFPEVKAWTLAKIERDLNDKIFFEDVRKAARPDYKIIKALFSR